MRITPLLRSTPEENRGRNTTAGVLEGFAPSGFANQRFALRLGSSTLACSPKGGRWAVHDHRFTEEAAPLFRLRVGEQRPFSAVHPKKRGAQYDGGCMRRLRPFGARGRGRRWWAINDGGCTRRLAPGSRKG